MKRRGLFKCALRSSRAHVCCHLAAARGRRSAGMPTPFNVSSARTHALVVIAATADSDLSWLSRAPRPFAIVDKIRDKIPNTGLDASSYLWWIINNYDMLPTWTCFMHPHEYHWHHPYYSQLVSMALDVDRMGALYLNVAHDREGRMLLYNKKPVKELNSASNQELREELLGLTTPFSGNVTYAPGAQFWVHKSRVLSHPRSFYQRLFAGLTDEKHALLSGASRFYQKRPLHVFFAEAHWHTIFGEGEHYVLPRKHYHDLAVLPAASWPSMQRRLPCDTPKIWERRRNCTVNVTGWSMRVDNGGNTR